MNYPITYEEKKREAIDTLVRLGVLKYAKDVESYHGRAGNESKWEVDPAFNNADNATGNRNVFKVSALYTGAYDIACEFALERARYNRQGNTTPEVHKIVPKDKFDVIVSDFNFSKLTKEEQEQFLNAFEILSSFAVSYAKPIPFKYKESYLKIKEILVAKQKQKVEELGSPRCNYFTPDDIADIVEKVSENSIMKSVFKTEEACFDFVNDLATTFNTQHLLMFGVVRYVINQMIIGKNNAKLTLSDNSTYEFNINIDYVYAWCKNNDFIGAECRVDSATLMKEITTISYFDLTEVETEITNGEKMAFLCKVFGDLSLDFMDCFEDQKMVKFLQKASASEIMEFVNEDETCKKLYAMDAKVWEGYSVGQHTEATLNFADSYFKYRVTPEIMPILKVALLAHDIGKGLARDPKSPYFGNDMQANIDMAEHLYDYLGVNPKHRPIFHYLIAGAQMHTTNFFVNGKDSALVDLQKESKDVLSICLRKVPTEDEVSGFMRLASCIQNCDSGSYTTYAKIRNEDKGFFYQGGNFNFTNSFVIAQDGMPALKKKVDIDYVKI